MKRVLVRLAAVVVFVEIAYLALANIALNLPLTQQLLNEYEPEEFAVAWERAWTWYPLRVHARGISANGQTSSQQWQADVAGASASMSLLPLLARTVRLTGVEAEDVDFRLRPRPKPDQDYAATKVFFPSIEGRSPDLPAKPKRKQEGRGWTIEVDEILARGRHGERLPGSCRLSRTAFRHHGGHPSATTPRMSASWPEHCPPCHQNSVRHRSGIVSVMVRNTHLRTLMPETAPRGAWTSRTCKLV